MKTLNEFHKHELLDRIDCFNRMFEELIANHPAAQLVKTEIDNVALELSGLYQAAGRA